MSTKPQTAEALLTQLRSVIDKRAEIDAELSDIKQQKAAIESELLKMANSLGTDVLRVPGVASITVRDKMTARTDPEKWDAVYAWCVEQDHTQCMRKQLNDKAVIELIEQGICPPGVTVDSFKQLTAKAL